MFTHKPYLECVLTHSRAHCHQHLNECNPMQVTVKRAASKTDFCDLLQLVCYKKMKIVAVYFLKKLNNVMQWCELFIKVQYLGPSCKVVITISKKVCQMNSQTTSTLHSKSSCLCVVLSRSKDQMTWMTE